jgi:hypothetical protein
MVRVVVAMIATMTATITGETTVLIIVTITEEMTVLITVTITAAEDKILTEVMAVVKETIRANAFLIIISKAGQAVLEEDKIIFPGLYVANEPQVSGLFCF